MKLKTAEMLANLACVTLGFSQSTFAADPDILVQPTNQVVMAGATASFMAVAAGSSPLNYQWLKNGTALADSAKTSGANSTNLILRDLAPLDAGAYSVMVTNLNGATNSIAATLRVQTWQNELPENGVASASSSDGVKLVAASGGGGIYVSTNSGAAWMLTSAPFQNWGALASSADGVKIVAAVQYIIGPFESHNPAPIYLSTNSGLSWFQAAAPSNIWYSVTSSADGSSLAAAAYGDGIYVSTNSGVSWSRTSAPTNGWTGVACSTNGQLLVAVADGDGIYLSSNSGAIWTKAAGAIGHFPSVASSADGTKLAVVDYYTSGFADGSIYTSGDAGSTWVRATAPIVAWASIASSVDGAMLAAASAYDGALGPGLIYFSRDSGTNWTDADAPAEGWTSIASSSDGNKLVATATSGAGFFTWPSVPALDISRAGNGVMVSWPDYALACVLQQKDDLGSIDWGIDLDAIKDNGTNRFIVVSPLVGSRFYRLTKP
jgi:hypothetical protein